MLRRLHNRRLRAATAVLVVECSLRELGPGVGAGGEPLGLERLKMRRNDLFAEQDAAGEAKLVQSREVVAAFLCVVDEAVPGTHPPRERLTGHAIVADLASCSRERLRVSLSTRRRVECLPSERFRTRGSRAD